MRYVVERSWTNRFMWPEKNDEQCYRKENIILNIDFSEEQSYTVIDKNTSPTFIQITPVLLIF